MNNFDDITHALFGKASRELSETERFVLAHAKERRTLTRNINSEFDSAQNRGDRMADRIARIGGSWGFIIGFILFLVFWAVVNTLILSRQAFDPYPFIFLNLVLSMIAAIQAPIIMMSQNRQAAKDRLSASKDYEVNLKSEVELIALHHKIDTVLLREIAELRGDVACLREQLLRAGENPEN